MGFAWFGAVAPHIRVYIERAAPYTHFIVNLIRAYPAVAIFSVIALEEIGVPLPLPGDAFIAYSGHLVARGRVSLVAAFVAIVIGSMAGSSVLYWLARHFGQPFVERYGPYMHIRPSRIERVQRWFVRRGPIVIIVGRHIPGMRMVISVFAGLFGVPYRVFLPSVAVSAAAWAAMFLFIGVQLDRQIGPYMNITPLHLIPSTIVMSASFGYALLLRHRARRAEQGLGSAPVERSQLSAQSTTA